MEGRFLKAFTIAPQQGVICGYQTLPISLRHRLILMSVESPFATGQGMPKPIDVIIAAKVLSSKSADVLSSTDPTDKDVEWMRKMDKSETTYAIECSKVLSAIEQQALWPSFWEKKKEEVGNGVPWILSVVCTLVKSGVPLEDAWTMPESQAIWMSASFAISEGAKIYIVTDKDIEAMEHLKAMRAQEAALREAKDRETDQEDV
jgi:hypothetical protein